MNITIELVRELVREQYPEWSNLEIRQVEKSGHDNRTFHLGDKMSLRLPSGQEYASQIEKELKWLPKLKPHISFNIPSPIAKGNPTDIYPFPWAINHWIEGENITYENVKDLNQLAIDLAKFLKELQSIDASNGPKAGKHNFYRGGDLRVYDKETRIALEKLGGIFPIKILEDIWNNALQSHWENDPVWVHGDIAVGNLLVKDERLYSIIDFGILGTGDPACDYVMAWTFFDSKSRNILKNELKCDEGTWSRARGWALWKALITYDINNKRSESSLWAESTIKELLKDIN